MLERIDVARISDEAHQIDIGRTLLTLLMGFFWLLGWLVGKLAIGIGAAITYPIAAARVGWRDAHQPSVRTRRRGAAA